MTKTSRHTFSYEYIRRVGKRANKFELDMRTVGIRYAIQHHRALQRLHTFHPGERAELDYTKWAVWAYPNKHWDEPELWMTGLCVDHYSGVIKGYVITAQPTAATFIRLYKRSVLPKGLWLPERLQRYADNWDVAGLDRLVVIDNGMDLRGLDPIIMFQTFGIILLRMPPYRGDLKGTIERTQSSIESHNISMLPGYVASKYRFTDPRQKRVLNKAKAGAKLLASEYEDALVPAIDEHNHAKHPRFNKSRIAVYRDGIEAAPPVLPTGWRQINSAFALTYSKRRVSREGVQIGGFKYNSPELNELYRVSDARVDVKLNPDDIRTVLIYHRELEEPIEARLTTHEFSEPTTLELAKVALGDTSSVDDGDASLGETASDRFVAKVYELQTGGRPQRPRTAKADVQAAADAAALPPVAPPAPSAIDDATFKSLFGSANDV